MRSGEILGVQNRIVIRGRFVGSFMGVRFVGCPHSSHSLLGVQNRAPAAAAAAAGILGVQMPIREGGREGGRYGCPDSYRFVCRFVMDVQIRWDSLVGDGCPDSLRDGWMDVQIRADS